MKCAKKKCQIAPPQARLPNFCVSFPQPMIFWNALQRTSLCAQVACVINKDRAGRRIRENPCEQTPHRAVPALASNHTFYGQNASFAKPKLTEKIGKDSWAKSFREIPVEKADACGAAMGRRDDAQNVRRGKDRPAAFTTYHGTFTST